MFVVNIVLFRGLAFDSGFIVFFGLALFFKNMFHNLRYRLTTFVSDMLFFTFYLKLFGWVAGWLGGLASM